MAYTVRTWYSTLSVVPDDGNGEVVFTGLNEEQKDRLLELMADSRYQYNHEITQE